MKASHERICFIYTIMYIQKDNLAQKSICIVMYDHMLKKGDIPVTMLIIIDELNPVAYVPIGHKKFP